MNPTTLPRSMNPTHPMRCRIRNEPTRPGPAGPSDPGRVIRHHRATSCRIRAHPATASRRPSSLPPPPPLPIRRGTPREPRTPEPTRKRHNSSGSHRRRPRCTTPFRHTDRLHPPAGQRFSRPHPLRDNRGGRATRSLHLVRLREPGEQHLGQQPRWAAGDPVRPVVPHSHHRASIPRASTPRARIPRAKRNLARRGDHGPGPHGPSQ